MHRHRWRVPAAVSLTLALASACGGAPLATGRGHAEPPAVRTSDPRAVATSDPPAGAASDPRGGGKTATPGPDPLAAAALWVDPHSVAAVHDTTGTAAERAAARLIARRPVATWFTGTHTGAALTVQVRDLMVDAAGRLPVFVAYDIPHRDCGDFSAGGAAGPAAYRAFIGALAAGLGSGPAAIIVEPDALSHLQECNLGPAGELTRSGLLGYAVRTLAARPHTAVYLEAGTTDWHDAAEIAARLEAADVAGARGFALNVADFKRTTDVVAFGQAVRSRVGGSFVIDTSRNGAGPSTLPAAQLPWCNPAGRALGPTPTSRTGVAGLDAYLWVKSPGVSDGQCGRGGPPAGTWFPAAAAALVADPAHP